MNGEIVVCILYRLAKIDGQYQKDQKKVLRTRAVITKDHYEMTNDNTNDSGLMYEIDQEATEKYYKDSQVQVKARKEAKAIEEAAGRGLKAALSSVGAAATKAIKESANATETKTEEKTEVIEKDEPVVLPDGDPNKDWTLPQIHKWLDEHPDKPKYKKTMGVDRMIEEVILPLLENETDSETKTEGDA